MIADVQYSSGAFETERNYDKLQIQNTEYHGTYGSEYYCEDNTHDMSAYSSSCRKKGACCYYETINNYVNPTTYTNYDGETLRYFHIL